MQPREFTLQSAIQAARANAGRQGGVAADALVVISADHVTWSDGSLGCPAPGMVHTQALVPGYRIRLRGPAGQALDYHASQRGTLVLCPAGRAIDPITGSDSRS
ncbi:hypothetical protein [Piscinibacter sakaiensis]|uniref:hypothetical protein n=1 Tax=Piscinibacter sakaiensis TaxID=1547922 RepID=UPI003AAF3BB1